MNKICIFNISIFKKFIFILINIKYKIYINKFFMMLQIIQKLCKKFFSLNMLQNNYIILIF